jgi:glycosyltransferase involved in cell wall biosynthesis
MKPIKIAIDIRMWKHAGIGRYIQELVKHLLASSANEELILLGNPGFEKELFQTLGEKKFIFRELSSKIYGVSEQWEVPALSKDADLLHVPHFNFPVFSKQKMAVTIHDLIYLHAREGGLGNLGRAYVRWLFKALQREKHFILTVSEATKKELLNFFPKISSERIFVTPEAASPFFRKVSDKAGLEITRQKFSLTKPFVLFVGSLKIHKNVPTLVEAMARLKKKNGLDHELILVGRADPKNKELPNLLQSHRFVRRLGELSDLELCHFYNLAKAFVLPSFREGFGLPVLEAMACGCPVVASNNSSLPEIVGDAGLLFDAGQVDALSEVLYNVLSNNELQEKMSKKGLSRAQFFSWEKTARLTQQVYQKALNEQ